MNIIIQDEFKVQEDPLRAKRRIVQSEILTCIPPIPSLHFKSDYTILLFDFHYMYL